MSNTLAVPVRRHITKPLFERRPDILRAARKGFQRSFFAFDIDQTLLRTDRTDPPITTTFTNRPVLDAIVGYLERGIPVVVISGNHMKMQRDRVIPALSALLKSRGELSLLQNFHFFANTGASRLQFGENGKLNGEASKSHCEEYGISKEDAEVMRNIFGEILPGFTWGATTGERIDTRSVMGQLLQITVKPVLPQQRREATVLKIREALFGKGIDPLTYKVLPGGSTSIDVSRSVIDKAFAIDLMMKELEIPKEEFNAEEVANPIFYFGDEFTLKADEMGNHVFGNDVSVLQVPNVIAFAVNGDQTLVPSHHRLIRAGSGPEATLEILRYLSLVSEAHRAVPQGTVIDFGRLRVPVIEEMSVDIPESLTRVDFQKAAIVMRVNTLLADPSREGSKNIASTEAIETAVESPVLAPVVNLLNKGIKIVLLSGDARERQIDRVVKDTIFNFLDDKSNIENLTLYANGGATKTAFTAKNGKLQITYHNGYNGSRKVDESELLPLVEQVVEGYRQRIKQNAKAGDREAQMYLAEIESGKQTLPKRQIELRSDSAQLAINYIMPAERDRVIQELRKLLKDSKLSDKYAVSEGGVRTIDINTSNANKATALEDHKESHGIETFLYFGSEFYLRLDASGQVRRGNDMEVLEVDNLIAFAHNQEQEEVHALRGPDRIIAAGSGANAAYVWLNHIAKKLKLGI